MADQPQLNITAAHEHFSEENFNKTWENIEKSDRTKEDDMVMLHSAIASLWHWDQRADASAENLSVGYWQVSRVFCLIGQPDLARSYGLLSLKYSETLEPFFKGYACETLARAEMQAGNRVAMLFYLDKAHEMAKRVSGEEDKQLLLKDLKTIK